MFEKTNEQLNEELERLVDHEQACNRLISLIETDEEIEVSDYFHRASLATLERLSDIIAHRIQAIDQYLEAQSNKEFDDFMKGRF